MRALTVLFIRHAHRTGLVLNFLAVAGLSALAQTVSTRYGTSYQVNVNAAGQNILGDAANEPSLCIDPTNPNRIAVGWRQFNDVNDGFRQAGWGYSTNGGRNWTFPGVLATNLFSSDPVLMADATGRFYYLGVATNGPNSEIYHCNLWRSSNGGQDWQALGFALGGDKEWMTVDTSASSGRGNLYQTWSPFFNFTNNDPNKIFSRSMDGGLSWMNPIAMARQPYFGTLDVGPNGEVYAFGSDNFRSGFVLNRSTNAANPNVTPTFELTTLVNLGGPLAFGTSQVNPDGLLGQGWIAVDRSSGPTRGNVYVLCSVVATDPADVMFARSTDSGRTFSQPRRINDDVPTGNTYHWLGALAVAPNGRIDVCWNDTRSNTNNTMSELYYSFSLDAGLSWSANHAVSPAFNHTLGYPGIPPQRKMGDYMEIVSLNDSACVAYAATFNGEEDIYFLRLEAPIVVSVTPLGGALHLSWNTIVGRSYCVQSKASLDIPWAAATTVGCVSASSAVATLDDPIVPGMSQRFYRIVEQP